VYKDKIEDVAQQPEEQVIECNEADIKNYKFDQILPTEIRYIEKEIEPPIQQIQTIAPQPVPVEQVQAVAPPPPPIHRKKIVEQKVKREKIIKVQKEVFQDVIVKKNFRVEEVEKVVEDQQPVEHVTVVQENISVPIDRIVQTIDEQEQVKNLDIDYVQKQIQIVNKANASQLQQSSKEIEVNLKKITQKPNIITDEETTEKEIEVEVEQLVEYPEQNIVQINVQKTIEQVENITEEVPKFTVKNITKQVIINKQFANFTHSFDDIEQIKKLITEVNA